MKPYLSPYKQFIFESYEFVRDTKTLKLFYSFDGDLVLSETYRFDFEYAQYDEGVLDRAVQLLFFMAGCSYYKKYIPKEIAVRSGSLDPLLAEFFTKTYEQGLGEFWFINKLDPRTPIIFPTTTQKLEPVVSENPGNGMLVGIGGGKDSLVSVELLRGHVPDVATWSVGHRQLLHPLVERIGLPHYWVERTWDPKLLELRKEGALSGHVPISGVIGCVGIVTAVLAGKQDVVVSNEQSANEPDFEYQGVPINHQYSKSQAFEAAFQDVLQHVFGDQLRYYSFLRPLSELHIAEIFSKTSFEQYSSVFSSCNRSFVHTSDHVSWCGACPKCAFTFLMLTPFVARERLERLWGGKNLLLDPALEPLYRQLLGIEGGKPLDCVGEIKESRSAMREAQKIYPELTEKYQFTLPDDYDFRRIYGHHMPPEVYDVFTQSLAEIN